MGLKPIFKVCRPVLAVILALIYIVLPLPVKADGGPIVGAYLWTLLKEGQQIAVVTIKDSETVEVNLFISILDSSEESHEVVFFVPLGADAAEFHVLETYLLRFDQHNTEGWDTVLQQEVARQHQVIEYLFGATLLTNGVWLMPFWLPLILSGCAAPPPEATFETDSSQVSIYGLEADTDIEGLIHTTGLDQSVRETLSRLRGQKIAVVNLQTYPQSTGDSNADGRITGEPGIHLSWTTSLIEGETGATYAYPLGTGTAWHHPIEMTRIYVVAPPGIDFSVTYPELGVNRSGYVRQFGGYQQRIFDNYDIAAYAVDEAYGDFGRVWRAVYTQSNAGEDIIITAGSQSATSAFFAGLRNSRDNTGLNFLIGFILAMGLWLLGWRYLGPRLLPNSYGSNPKKLRQGALLYIAVNALLMIPGGVLYALWSWTGIPLAPALLFILFGGAGLLFFATNQVRRLGIPTRQAIKAYALVTLASNGVYLVLVLAYAKLTGII
jgi:hypothetical protein